MAVTHDQRPPYREEPHDAYASPSRYMLDTASAFWTVVAAGLAGAMLIWILYLAWAGTPVITVDMSGSPWVEMQPITPPAPVPATRPAPTP
jgi:hypothetical protein